MFNILFRETDIEEVLQIDNIFSDVSKGIIANNKELTKAFGGAQRKKIISEILTRGELQISKLERDLAAEKLKKDIANIVATKTLNMENNTHFPISV